jgi:hypothetical protein
VRRATLRTAASPITRMGTSVEDGWRESSRRGLLAGVPLAFPRLANQLNHTGSTTDCPEQAANGRHQFDDSLGLDGAMRKRPTRNNPNNALPAATPATTAGRPRNPGCIVLSLCRGSLAEGQYGHQHRAALDTSSCRQGRSRY